MSLSVWSILFGLFFGVTGVLALVRPELTKKIYHKFSRDVWTGRILSMIAWIWAAIAVLRMGLDFLAPFQTVIVFLGIVCIPLTWFWLENLLPCRAFGGLLTLIPYELLHVARIHPSPWRLALVILAYVMIVWGMILILYPWKMRELLDWIISGGRKLRIYALSQILLGVFFLISGCTVLT